MHAQIQKSTLIPDIGKGVAQVRDAMRNRLGFIRAICWGGDPEQNREKRGSSAG